MSVSELKAKPARVFRLRTILLYVHLVILLLPITGLGVLRVYENELMRRTEGELLAAGAFIRAHYMSCWAKQAQALGLRPQEAGVYIEDEQLRLRHRGVFHHIPSTVDVNALRPEPMAAPGRAAPAGWAPPHEAIGECASASSALMKDAQQMTLAGMRIVDDEGVVIASSRGEMGLSLRHRAEVERAIKGRYVHVVRERHTDEPMPPLTSLSRRSSVRLFIAMPMVWKDHVIGAVILSRTPLSLTRALYDNRRAFIGFGVGLLVAVLLLTWYISRAILKPISSLIEQAGRLKRGDREAAIPLARPVTVEVKRLSEAVVEMAQALEERADYIKTFASNVSHEFKTPLASIRATVELFEDHLSEMSEQERSRFLQIIDKDAERLQRLVGRLLELARADVLRPDQQRADALEVIEEVVHRYQEQEMALKLVVDEAISGAQVRMAAVTLSSILINLLDNARQHGGAKAQVIVSARRQAAAKADASVLELSVEDDGPGISAANRERIFTPFFTTARERGGTGMGLAVVSSLVQAHDGSLSLEPTDQGARFVITLPLWEPGQEPTPEPPSP